MSYISGHVAGRYEVIVRESERELAESVRTANFSGFVAVGPLIVDGGNVLQVLRKVREGYVTADGEACDGNGRIFPSVPEQGAALRPAGRSASDPKETH